MSIDGVTDIGYSDLNNDWDLNLNLGILDNAIITSLTTDNITPINGNNIIVNGNININSPYSFIGNLTGNATTATTFTGSLAGNVIGTMSATVIPINTVTNSMLSGSIADSKLLQITSANKVANSATTGVNTNGPNCLVLRDGAGSFIATQVTAQLIGNCSGSAATFTGSLAGNITGPMNATVIPNATITNLMLAAATILDVPNTVVLRDSLGNITSSENITISTSLSNSGHWQLWNNSSILRWLVGLLSTETGGNVGSDFNIYRYSDSGAYIDSVLSIQRLTGDISIFHNLSVTGTVYSNLVGSASTITGLLVSSNIPAGIISNAMISTLTNNNTPSSVMMRDSNCYTYLNRLFTMSDSSRIHWNMQNSSNIARFIIGLANAESGSNIGSDFTIYNYSDTGAFLGNVFNIQRSTGNVGIPNILSVSGSINGNLVGSATTITGHLVSGNIPNGLITNAMLATATSGFTPNYICQRDSGGAIALGGLSVNNGGVANYAGIVSIISGSASYYVSLAIGRSYTDCQIGVAAAVSQLCNDSQIADMVFTLTSTGSNNIKFNVGSASTVSALVINKSSTATTAPTNGTVVCNGGMGIYGNLNVSSNISAGTISNTPISYSNVSFSTLTNTTITSSTNVVAAKYLQSLAIVSSYSTITLGATYTLLCQTTPIVFTGNILVQWNIICRNTAASDTISIVVKINGVSTLNPLVASTMNGVYLSYSDSIVGSYPGSGYVSLYGYGYLTTTNVVTRANIVAIPLM